MSAKRFTPDIIARAEELVSRIQGISSCRISTDETGVITEVHVVATGQKPPKLVARDVETCLAAELGIHVDYKKIGVVIFDSAEAGDEAEHEPQVDEKIVEFPLEEHPARFAFHSVNLFLSKESVQAEVELVKEGLETFGSAKSDNLSTSCLDLVAEATLRAVSEYLDPSIRLCLCDVVEPPIGDELVVVVRVDVVEDGRRTQCLAGCSLDSGNINKTVVFAALDALNRVLGKLKSRKIVEYKIK